MEGFIKLYRKLLDNPIVCKDSDHIAVFIYLLLNATHKEKESILGKDVVILKPGQLITGRKQISATFKINESKIERVLKLFEKCKIIEQQMTSRNRLVTLVSWHEYQKSEQQVNNKCTTSEQQVNNKCTTSEHIQECKNGIMKEWENEKMEEKRKEKSITSNSSNVVATDDSATIKKVLLSPQITFDFTSSRFSEIPEVLIKQWEECFPAVDIKYEIKRAEAWQTANPAKRRKDYKRFLFSWMSRVQEQGGTKGFEKKSGEVVQKKTGFLSTAEKSEAYFLKAKQRLEEKNTTIEIIPTKGGVK